MAMKRAVRYALVGAAVLVVLIVALVVVLTRTDFGVERAGRFAVDRIRGSVNGELDVGRVTSGGLLSGVTLHDVAIRGPEGRSFVEADSARLTYRFRTLLGGSIVFDRLILHSPTVTIERLPGADDWNYEIIFAGDSTSQDTTGGDGLVLIQDATIHDGRVFVRMPWEPDGPVEPDDTARLILESVPGGRVRTLRFDQVEARAPRIVWEAPEEDARLIEIAELSADAYIWETPLHVREAEGVVTIRDSLVSFDVPRARLPDSELGLVGRVILGSGDEDNRYDLEVDGRDVAFADFQWLYPPLPRDGGGTLQFRMQTQASGGMLWLARDARLSTSGTEVAGSFGVVTGDTLFFTNVDLEASPLDLELLNRLVPSDLPLEGLLIGTVEVEGPISALRTRGDVRLRTFRNGQGAESTVRWSGTLGAERPYAARNLDADVQELDLEQVAQFVPELRLRGRATGRVEANGSLERGLEVAGAVALDRAGYRSAIRGSGRFAIGGDRSLFDLRFDAEPVALELLTEQFPSLGRVAGEAHGPVTVTGTLDELNVDADIMTPAGGVLVRGTFALTGPVPRYRAEGHVTEFQLDRVASDLPETVVTGRFDVQGEGDRPETLDMRGEVEVLSARVAGVEVGPSLARGSVADGLLRLDSASITTEVGIARATGSFGVVEGRIGELTISAHADGLTALEPILFPDVQSPFLATEPEVRLAGEVEATGVVTGSVHEWSAVGRTEIRDLVYDEVSLATAAADFDWRPDSVVVDASVDSVRLEDRRLPHARGTVTWSAAGGRLVARARGIGDQQLDLEGAFDRNGDGFDLQLRQIALTTREGRWASADTVHARIGQEGVAVDSLVLERAPQYARIRLAGTLPWRQPGESGNPVARLDLALDSVKIGEVLRVVQLDTTLDGTATGRFQVRGTALSPEIEGSVMIRPFRYRGAVLDSAGADLAYRGRMIRTRIQGWRSGDAILTGAGTVPVELALTDRRERLLDQPMDLRFQADSVPAGLVSFLAPGFSDLGGAVDGELALVGTSREPELEGELRLLDGTAVFDPLGVRYQDMNITARMASGSVMDIEGRLATVDGHARIRGTLDLTEPRDPGFDLRVAARRLEASRRRDVAATVTGEARLTGRYTRPVVSGNVQILEGEMNLDEIWRQYQIVQLDPSLLQMFDSTAVRFRPPREIPFLKNLLLTDATLTAQRDFWLRSRELDVEVSGTLALEVDRQVNDFRLTGALQAQNGSYSIQLAQGVPGRVFDIREGTIEFVGTPGIDPNLAIQAGYRVRRAQGDPIDVMAQVSGTLKNPRVQLTSDSDLPLSESDLASYILFGRSGAELTQAETDILSSGIGLVRPVATSLMSSGAQWLLAGTGLPVDYVVFTTPEYDLDVLNDEWQVQGFRSVLHNTQVEVGIDAGRDLSLVGTLRFVAQDPGAAPEGTSALRMFRGGARVEWRFWPTWTTEVFIEDRFARTPSFGLTEIDDRKVWGLSLVRDWGY